MSKQYKLIRCNINGKDVEKMVDVRASLTDMLRNDQCVYLVNEQDYLAI